MKTAAECRQPGQIRRQLTPRAVHLPTEPDNGRIVGGHNTEMMQIARSGRWPTALIDRCVWAAD